MTSVLVVSRSCPPDVGGYQTQLSIVLPRLANRGVRLRAVAAQRTHAKGRQGWPGVVTTVIPAFLLPSRVRFLCDIGVVGWAAAWGVVARIRGTRPVLLLASPTMRGARVLVLFWSATSGSVVVRYPGPNDFRRGALWKRPGVRHLVLSPAQLQDAISVGVSAELIRNAVVPAERRDSRRAESHRFVSVGRLTREKRFDLLLDAWSLVAEELPEWRLAIIGGDQDSRNDVGPELRRLAAQLPRVTMCGEIPGAREHLLPGDVLVHCSYNEGSPNAVLEAMAESVPVVVAEDAMRLWFVDPPPHIPWDGQTSQSLSRVLLEAARTPTIRERVGRSASEVVRRNWSPEAAAAQWMTILEAG